MKVGVVGAGGFARQVSLPAFSMVPNVEIAAIYDIDEQAARSVAEMHGIGVVCKSLDELLAIDLDLVYLATPPAPQYALVSAVIAANRNFLVEKPAGRGSREVEELLAKADAAGLVHAVNHEMRFASIYRTIHKMVAEGFVGNIRHVTLSAFVDHGANPAYPTYYHSFATLRSHSGGILRQFGSHYLDLMQYIFGELQYTAGYAPTMQRERPAMPKNAALYSRVDPDPSEPLLPVDADDQAVLFGRLANGAPVSLNLGWSVYHHSGPRWEIYGDEGTLRYQAATTLFGGSLLGGRKGDTELSEIPLLPEYNPESLATPSKQLTQCIAMSLADIFKAVAGDREGRSYCTLRDELNVWRGIELVDGVHTQ